MPRSRHISRTGSYYSFKGCATLPSAYLPKTYIFPSSSPTPALDGRPHPGSPITGRTGNISPAEKMPRLGCPAANNLHSPSKVGSGQVSIGISADELSAFGMNDDNKLKTAAGLSCLWDGEPIRRV